MNEIKAMETLDALTEDERDRVLAWAASKYAKAAPMPYRLLPVPYPQPTIVPAILAQQTFVRSNLARPTERLRPHRRATRARHRHGEVAPMVVAEPRTTEDTGGLALADAAHAVVEVRLAGGELAHKGVEEFASVVHGRHSIATPGIRLRSGHVEAEMTHSGYGQRGVKSARKPFNDRAGYIASLRSAPGRGWVVIYNAEAQGMDVGEKYAVVCETHSTSMAERSVANARLSMKMPTEWCEECRDATPPPVRSAPKAPPPAEKPTTMREYMDRRGMSAFLGLGK